MSKVVIFDWGGVIMRTHDQGPRHAWDAHLGLPSGSVESVVHGLPEWEAAQCGTISLDDYWAAVGANLGLSDRDLAGLRADFYSGDQADGALFDLIQNLNADGIPVGLMSNNTLDLHDTLIALNADSLFSAIVISAEIGVMKPDPAAYHAILNVMGVAPEQAIFIDDFMRNVEGARAIGMEAIHFTPGIGLDEIVYQWLHA